VRRVMLLFMALILGWVPAAAECAFLATAMGEGEAVLRLSPSAALAEITASMTLSGTLDTGDREVSFKAEGLAVGSATIDILSLGIAAWIVVYADGATDDGEALSVRGGITITDITGDVLSSSSGSGSGGFDLALATPTLRLRTRGTATGSASGQFVPSDARLAMQVAGSASIELCGAVDADRTTVMCAGEPDDVLDSASWPEELADLLSESLKALSEGTLTNR